MPNQKPQVSAAPHIRAAETTSDIMLDVLIALTPAAVMGTYFFGFRSALIIAVSIASAVLSEFIFCLIVRRKGAIRDLSAAVTGLLLAMSLPVSVPLWIPAIGAAFAIILVKQVFGGIGQNFLNPALGARAFLLAAYPVMMTNWEQGGSGRVFDAFTGATPLAALRDGTALSAADIGRAFHGNILGSIGETCVWALLLGFGFLLFRRVVTWRVPIAYLAMFTLFTWVFGRNGMFTGNPLNEILLGAVLIGAFFMATDYSTSPITPKGQLIFGAGCGLLNAVFRIYGSFPEGTTYAILLMNICTPLIDRFTVKT